MKKFINEVDDFILESLSGLAQTHPNLVSVNLDPMYVIRKTIANKKVVLISGGGSGPSLFTQVLSAMECLILHAPGMCLPHPHPIK